MRRVDFGIARHFVDKKQINQVILPVQFFGTIIAGRTSIDVGKIVGMNPVSVNSWLNRYKSDKIKGLLVKAGRGRKALINKESDTPLILETVKSNRQRLQTAKAEWESLSVKTVSGSTFKRFLKALLGRHSAADTNG